MKRFENLSVFDSINNKHTGEFSAQESEFKSEKGFVPAFHFLDTLLRSNLQTASLIYFLHQSSQKTGGFQDNACCLQGKTFHQNVSTYPQKPPASILF